MFGDRELGRLAGLVRGDITRALEALPEVYRTAVVLADVEGWTWEEVAAALDVPIGTVQSRVFRGRRALRTLLEDYAPR
jgi:RNA polymerase sigma-70 factor (ECF subfamily)